MPEMIWYVFIVASILTIIYVVSLDLANYNQLMSNETMRDCAVYKQVIYYAKKCVEAKAQVSVDCGAIVVKNFTRTAGTWPMASLGAT